MRCAYCALRLDAKAYSRIDRITAFVKTWVLALPPRSAVRLPGSSIAASAAASTLAAAWRSWTR